MRKRLFDVSQNTTQIGITDFREDDVVEDGDVSGSSERSFWFQWRVKVVSVCSVRRSHRAFPKGSRYQMEVS
jgi:hypothetical protein